MPILNPEYLIVLDYEDKPAECPDFETKKLFNNLKDAFIYAEQNKLGRPKIYKRIKIVIQESEE